MAFEIETAPGDEPPNTHEIKKEMLRRSMGISKEEFERRLDVIKEFFELRKVEIIRDIQKQGRQENED